MTLVLEYVQKKFKYFLDFRVRKRKLHMEIKIIKDWVHNRTGFTITYFI